MRVSKICLLLIACTVINTITIAQPKWTWQNPYPQGLELNSIGIIDSTTAITVGEIATILKTTDRGVTWRTINKPGKFTIYQPVFLNTLTGYAGTYKNSIYSTTDGGENWFQKSYSWGDTTFQSGWGNNVLFFLTQTVGWVAANNGESAGVLAKTTDAGNTWQVFECAAMFSSLYFHNDLVGIGIARTNVFTGTDFVGVILRTTNGGETWDTVFTNPTGNFTSLNFINNSVGYAAGGGAIYRTDNGGLSWYLYYNPGYGLYYSNFFNSNHFLYYTSGAEITRTTDGGLTWSNNPTELPGFKDMKMFDTLHGVAIGSFGKLYYTSDGGYNWGTASRGFVQELNDVFFYTDSLGWAVGDSGTVLKTTNGGDIWEKKETNISDQIEGVHFVSPQKGYFITLGTGKIFRSIDGGETWSLHASYYSSVLYDIDFPTSEIGYIGRRNGIDNQTYDLLKTTNGGDTWNSVYDFGTSTDIYRIQFLTPSLGWIVGSYMKRTTNGGTSWTNLSVSPYGSKFAFHFRDQNNGIMASAVDIWGYLYLHRTTNSGTSWPFISSTLFYSNLGSIHYRTNSNAFLVFSSDGKLYETTNGGISWKDEYRLTNRYLWKIFFRSPAEGWVVGQGGAIIKYSNASAPKVKLLSPNGNEYYQSGDTIQILWTSQNCQKLKIEYSSNSGITWIFVDSVFANQSYYTYILPTNHSLKSRIRISESLEPLAYDISDYDFFIYKIPPTPVPVSPSSTTNLILPVRFSWIKSFSAIGYHLQISQEEGFGSTILEDSSIVDTAYWSNNIPYDSGQLFWRVRAKSINGYGSWSQVLLFNMLSSPRSPIVFYPIHGARELPTSIKVIWSGDGLYIDKHKMIVFKDQSIIYENDNLIDTSFVLDSLENSVQYWLELYSHNIAGWGSNRDIAFTTHVGQPTLNSPPYNAQYVSTFLPTLNWYGVQSATKYKLEVSKDSSFTNLQIVDSMLTDTSRRLPLLDSKKEYFWRVQAKGESVWGLHSRVWKFTTKANKIIAPDSLKITIMINQRVNLTWKDMSNNETNFMILKKTGMPSQIFADYSIADTVDSNVTSVIDSNVISDTTYNYRVVAINKDTVSAMSGYASILITSMDEELFIPDAYSLDQNYPNPFNPSTTIRYGLPYASVVRIEVYDMTGQKLRTLIEKEQNAGFYEAVFDIDGLSSGTYFYVLTARQLEGENKFHQVKKMILMK